VKKVLNIDFQEPFASAVLLSRKNGATVGVIGEARARGHRIPKYILRDPLLDLQQIFRRDAYQAASAAAGYALFVRKVAILAKEASDVRLAG
jgi:hypothetical protein